MSNTVSPVDKLHEYLADAEANASKMQIGDIAWLIANFPEGYGPRNISLDAYPRITARIAEFQPMESEGRAVLQLSQFRNDDNHVGAVADMIIRIWGDNPSFRPVPKPVPAPPKERSVFNLKRSDLVVMLEQYLECGDADAAVLKAEIGDRYKTCSGPEFATLFSRHVGMRIRFAGQFEGEDDFEQVD